MCLHCFKHLNHSWVLNDRHSVVGLWVSGGGRLCVSCMDQWVFAKVPLSSSHSNIAQLFTFQMGFAAQVSQQAGKTMQPEKIIIFFWWLTPSLESTQTKKLCSLEANSSYFACSSIHQLHTLWAHVVSIIGYSNTVIVFLGSNRNG